MIFCSPNSKFLKIEPKKNGNTLSAENDIKKKFKKDRKMNFNHCMKYRMHKLKEESEFHLYKKPRKEESEGDVELTKVAPLHPQERLKRINKKTIKKTRKSGRRYRIY